MLHSLHPVFDLMFSFNRSIFLLQFCNHFNPSQIENKCAQRIIFRTIYQQLIFFRDQTIFPALWIHNILSKQIILRDHSALGGQLWSQSLLCCARCESQNRPVELRSVPCDKKIVTGTSEILFFHLPCVRFLFWYTARQGYSCYI